VEQISRHVLLALQTRKPEPERPGAVARPEPLSPPAQALKAVEPPPAAPQAHAVRRVTPFRLRSGSMLGLDIVRAAPEAPQEGSEGAADAASGAELRPPG
jgi:hypothetical protein